VIRLEPVAPEQVEGARLRRQSDEPDDDVAIAEEVDAQRDETPTDGLHPSSGPGAALAARVLRPPPRRGPDPLLVWSIVGGAAVLSIVAAYLMGHSNGLDDAFAELGRPAGVVAAKALPPSNPAAEGTTERELFRLCRALEETRPDFEDRLQESTEAGRRALEEWAARWRNGFDGPLGKVAAELDLTFDWTCYVQGYELGKGFDCTTRATGGAAFRLNVYGLGARFYKGIEELEAGSALRLEGMLAALREGRGTRLQVGLRCEITLLTDQAALVHVERPR
jgi:hypothetical protein